MSDVKWIKVAVDMFDHDKIDFLRSLPEGDSIIVTWIQMLTIAGKSNNGGYLMVTDRIPYTEQLLSNKLRRQPVFLQFALNTLESLNMINVEEGPYHITNWEKHQNANGLEKIKSDTAKRVAKHRQLKKEQAQLLQGNVTKSLHVTHGNETELRTKNKEKESSSSEDVFHVYQNNIGFMSGDILQMLEDDIETYGAQMVCDAIKEAARQGKNKLSYVEGILKRWKTDGRENHASSTSTVGKNGVAAHHSTPKLRTVEEMQADEEARSQRLIEEMRSSMY